ncbi:MAG: hypothetical protein R3234_03605 [Thermoanaerobaculia bacterium]|nr:hypothetical protein [Thermoanaerobaculia bacterium]
MGTFHRDKGDLHGITVVVETEGPELYVGRCDEVTDEGVILLDADVHREDGEGPDREEYLDRASRFGVWGKIRRLVVARDRVSSIRPLGDL